MSATDDDDTIMVMAMLDGGLRSLRDANEAQLTVGDLAVEVPILPGTSTCEDLDRLFGRTAGGSCAVVRHPHLDGVVGLVERGRFEALMSGPYGYGRSLYGRRLLADVAQWDALTLTPETTVVEASSRAITRSPEHVQDHVLVQAAGSVRAVPMPVLLSAVARDLANQALRDPLTGLANREAFFGRVEESCRRSATQPGHQTAVLYLDVDGFKSVNDTLGHDRGDALLNEVAAALIDAARPVDLVARLGGDEFAVCLDVETGPGAEVDTTLAERVATRMHEAVAGLRRDDAVQQRVRVSVGVAVTAGGPIDARALVRAADLAMYRGKRDGGDVVVGPVVVATSAHADPLLDTSIEAAIARGEFRLLYQPIVALRDGRLASLEALVRWQHPRLGLLTPDAFLPAAQRAGQLVALDDWVLRTATSDFAAWMHAEAAAGRDRPVALNVNVSTDRLLSAGLDDVLRAAAAAANLEPGLVRVEVPEQLLVDQLGAATEALDRLSEAGFKVTLDDVGAGGTSLRHLREVHADGLKIDRSYVQRILTDDRDRALVQMLVDFAASTGIAVTAEGVETLEQRDALLAMGCQYAQGWLFSRAAPLSEARAPSALLPV
ncbi:putative bifunctional diguanylate cyclase/phosphodiesterase [Blastococcus haudaquaticus]|uniref:Diguanylate cyclase (GGDEF) domain-containing protein n=1 Tax=Blastococcus haudaquaticus TaxID=1938745 RepID=A0A286H717_9ACTN|nr:EAL domain-containing protein [Blastococcus haudaquaticus]SOE03541.1 diguanylate cyclase (GGDEF) domain-containing protein [Blastococcus haudaquaticus]